MAYLKNCINITLTSILLNLTLGAMERRETTVLWTRPLKSKKNTLLQQLLKAVYALGRRSCGKMFHKHLSFASVKARFIEKMDITIILN